MGFPRQFLRFFIPGFCRHAVVGAIHAIYLPPQAYGFATRGCVPERFLREGRIVPCGFLSLAKALSSQRKPLLITVGPIHESPPQTIITFLCWAYGRGVCTPERSEWCCTPAFSPSHNLSINHHPVSWLGEARLARVCFGSPISPYTPAMRPRYNKWYKIRHKRQTQPGRKHASA